MGEQTVGQRQLNRTLLARQGLLDRYELALPAALESFGGLQAQYAPAMYIGLWSRLAGFTRADLTEALEARTVAQGTLLRSTIHLVSATDYWAFAQAVREERQQWYLRVTKDVQEAALVAAADELRAALAGGPLRRSEIDKLIGPPIGGVAMWVDLVRVPPSGTWERRRADLYGLADDWLGPPKVTPDEGLELLVRRYLEGFAPAPRADIARWIGVGVKAVTPALDRLDLRRYRADDGAELVDLPDAALADADTPAPVRFLPTWDATLLVHARRTLILPEEHRPKIFNTRMPQSVPTFLVDGAVAGTWKYHDGQIEVTPFGRLSRAARREVDDEAERLAAFHA